MYCFVILLLFNKMQMSVRRFSAIPHLRGRISAEAWSLNSRTTRTGSGLLFSVGEGTGCSVALMAIKRVMVEFNKNSKEMIKQI